MEAQPRFDKESLRKQYEEVCPKFEKLAEQLKKDIINSLKRENIDFLDVSCRTKDFGSFWDKAERKGYKEPLKEIEDICGLRVICFFPSDLDKVIKIIEREFEVKDLPGKKEITDPEKFGYRSFHYIVVIKKGWATTPIYKDIVALKAEIQVRTILSHAWADISHKLAYKQKDDIPVQLKRKFSQLSALLEVADERFEELRRERENYRASLIERGEFDLKQPLNLDSLQAFFDFYFPKRFTDFDFYYRELRNTKIILDDMRTFGISLEDLFRGYEKCKHYLFKIEDEFYKLIKKRFPKRKESIDLWIQFGFASMILYLTNNDYYNVMIKKNTSPVWIETVEKWRPIIKRGDS